jgi:hypothetical protein
VEVPHPLVPVGPRALVTQTCHYLEVVGLLEHLEVDGAAVEGLFAHRRILAAGYRDPPKGTSL